MKEVMIITALAFMTTIVQTQMLVDHLMRKYEHSPKAEYVHVPKMMMSPAKAITTNDANDYSRHTKHINSIKVLNMKDRSKVIKQQSFRDAARLKTVGHEELVTAKEASEQIVIVMKRSKTRIKEPVVVDSGDDDAVLIQILGNIRNSEIQKILAEEKKR